MPDQAASDDAPKRKRPRRSKATPESPAAAVGKASPTSGVHARTRADHATELAEDYVEAIAEIEAERGVCRAVDLARLFSVSAVTATKTIGRLQRDGFVDTAPYKPVTLTPLGASLARKARRRHEIVYRFLRSLGISERVAAADAEGIEHHVSAQTLKRFEAVTKERTEQADESVCE